MKKKILVYALSALTCGLFTSCSDWLDINHDPNTAEKVDPGYLFNSGKLLLVPYTKDFGIITRF